MEKIFSLRTVEDTFRIHDYLEKTKMIENIRNGFVKQYHWDEIAGLPRDGSVTLLDTRTAYEYKSGHIDGYINIPVVTDFMPV